MYAKHNNDESFFYTEFTCLENFQKSKCNDRKLSDLILTINKVKFLRCSRPKLASHFIVYTTFCAVKVYLNIYPNSQKILFNQNVRKF